MWLLLNSRYRWVSSVDHPFGQKQLAFDARAFINDKGGISVGFEIMGSATIGPVIIPGYLVIEAFVTGYNFVFRFVCFHNSY